MANVLNTHDETNVDVHALCEGDRLSQIEFHRRYERVVNKTHYELLNGVVHIAAAQRYPHSFYEGILYILVGKYAWKTPGVEMLSHPTTILDDENEPQPDVVLRVLSEYGGRSEITPSGYLSGPPELVIEISHSALDRDLNEKRLIYQNHGVLEYIVVCVEQAQFRWFVWPAGERLVPVDGILKSVTFPGLWIDSQAVFEGRTSAMEQALESGTSQPEHAAFVQLLQSRKAT